MWSKRAPKIGLVVANVCGRFRVKNVLCKQERTDLECCGSPQTSWLTNACFWHVPPLTDARAMQFSVFRKANLEIWGSTYKYFSYRRRAFGYLLESSLLHRLGSDYFKVQFLTHTKTLKIKPGISNARFTNLPLAVQGEQHWSMRACVRNLRSRLMWKRRCDIQHSIVFYITDTPCFDAVKT